MAGDVSPLGNLPRMPVCYSRILRIPPYLIGTVLRASIQGFLAINNIEGKNFTWMYSRIADFITSARPLHVNGQLMNTCPQAPLGEQ